MISNQRNGSLQAHLMVLADYYAADIGMLDADVSTEAIEKQESQGSIVHVSCLQPCIICLHNKYTLQRV